MLLQMGFHFALGYYKCKTTIPQMITVKAFTFKIRSPVAVGAMAREYPLVRNRPILGARFELKYAVLE